MKTEQIPYNNTTIFVEERPESTKRPGYFTLGDKATPESFRKELTEFYTSIKRGKLEKLEFFDG